MEGYVKTGECYFIDDNEQLCLSESYCKEETGEVTTIIRVIE
jgi:hypothetical protein